MPRSFGDRWQLYGGRRWRKPVGFQQARSLLGRKPERVEFELVARSEADFAGPDPHPARGRGTGPRQGSKASGSRDSFLVPPSRMGGRLFSPERREFHFLA